jgi:hypothetical protein
MPFARMIGHEPISVTPYANHSATPREKVAYMPDEIAYVSRVRIVFSAYGTNDSVVALAARYPMSSLFMRTWHVSP